MNIKIVSAGKTEIFNFAMPIGVGLIESAINLTKLCEFDRPDYLIFIGSAGSYGKLNIFDIIESKTASNIENCFFKKECYTPIDNIISLENVSHETKIVNSSNYITTNPSLAKAYLKLNIQAENMEFFSVMRVAQEFEIPVLGIFVVTNYTDKNAHRDFLANHNRAKKLLNEYMVDKYKDLKK